MKKEYGKGDGDLPVRSVKGNSIPEAWENSVVDLYKNGLWYERRGPKDKENLQIDSTMTIEIQNPDSDLFMHKYMTCGWDDLFEYAMEIFGAKNSWRAKDSEDTKWEYTYNERLESYPGVNHVVNQLESMIQGLSEEHWKRRNNMVTWIPEKDIDSTNPPCLQGIWTNIIPNEQNGGFKLNFNYTFRSRNVMIASPMNMIGLQAIQSYVRDEVIKKTGMDLKNGRMVDHNFSYHVSARDQNIFEDFVKRLEASNQKEEAIGERSYTKDTVFPIMDTKGVKEKIIDQTKNYLSGKELEKEIEKINKISERVKGLWKLE